MKEVPTNSSPEHIERNEEGERRALEKIKEVRNTLDAFEQRIGQGKLDDQDCDIFHIILSKLVKELYTAF